MSSEKQSFLQNENPQTKKEKRDYSVLEYLADLYVKASLPESDSIPDNYKKELDEVFDTNSWGFRELLLTVVVGMHLDKEYRASTELYKSKPRALYEGPIKKFCLEKNLPHRKSGPLNIAKAASGIDEEWAKQRKPKNVADDVVNLVDFLEDPSIDEEERTERVDAVGIDILRRLKSKADALKQLTVELPPSEDPEFLYQASKKLIDDAPDSGNTPQKIAALLLKTYHTSMGTGIYVSGEKDRASVTSTTSNKPGDVNEESNDRSKILKVYEITVKPFDLARIRDSYDTIRIYNNNSNRQITEITVICRPQDCPENLIGSGLHEYLGHATYQNIVYRYWNIYEWTASTLQRMAGEGRRSYYDALNSYINDVNTAESVKKVWKDVNAERKA